MSIELEPERMAKRFYEASQRLAPAYNQPVPPAWSDLPSEQRIFLSVVGGAVLSQLEEEKAQVSHSRSVVLLGSEFTDFNLCYEEAIGEYTLNFNFRSTLEIIDRSSTHAPGVVAMRVSLFEWLIESYKRNLAEEEARRNGGPAEKGAADGRRV